METHIQRIAKLQSRLAALDVERAGLKVQLEELEKLNLAVQPEIFDPPGMSVEAKIRLFRSLFKGRADIFPIRWESSKTSKSGYAISCGNEWVRGLCNKPRVKCSSCEHKAFLPVTDEIIRFHLTGRDARHRPFCVGVYPMLQDETCWFLAADFDKEHWEADVTAFIKTCDNLQVPAYVERSRSGNGAHVWFFFANAVPAADARQLGTYLLTKTMDSHPELGFASYDRLFPSQDTLPKGGLGNLIALPLQNTPRGYGNSVFLDASLKPYPDQWALLSSVERISPKRLNTLISEAKSANHLISLPFPEDDEFAKTPWVLSPSRPHRKRETSEKLPKQLAVVVSDQIYIAKAGLPPSLRNDILRLAAFQNPEFYRAQAMRFPTFGKPRIIACTEDFPLHLALPRGVFPDLRELTQSLGVELLIKDERFLGERIQTAFTGQLTDKQRAAQKALLAEYTGVLSATTGFGKTVLAASLIAERGINTLILVHRRQLLDQWLARLDTFLDTEHIKIGHLGAGKRKLSGQIDVAIIQSLVKQGKVDDCVADYGQVIVDECHHISAVSFELVARRSKAKYFLGLTATPFRKDGHHPIIFMQCGPIRFRVDAKEEAAKRNFNHHYFLRHTEFSLVDTGGPHSIQSIYEKLAQDEARNDLIFDDVLKSLDAGRSPVLLTERREHVEHFAKRFIGFAKNIIVLQGGMGVKQRRDAYDKLKNLPISEERLIIATGRYLGEGFDDARLDTLFLAMPISWRGTLAQYAGRLHRTHDGKDDVVIIDYVDGRVPMLSRMQKKRTAGCKNLGYDFVSSLVWDNGQKSKQ